LRSIVRNLVPGPRPGKRVNPPLVLQTTGLDSCAVGGRLMDLVAWGVREG